MPTLEAMSSTATAAESRVVTVEATDKPKWHARLCTQAPGIGLAGACVSAQALLAIGAEQPGRGVDALSGLLESAGAGGALAALDEWVDRLGGR